MKVCSKCGENKPTSEFYTHKQTRDGLRPACKACTGAQNKAWRLDNPERMAELVAAWEKANPTSSRERALRWYHANSGNVASSRRDSYPEKAEVLREKSRVWRRENPQRVSETNRAWAAKNQDKVKAYSDAARSSPKGRIDHSVRSAVRAGIRAGAKAGRKTFDLLGFSSAELRAHLEVLFEPGMSWANYGEWHIDHIRPLASFRYDTPDHPDFTAAWSLKNLQPLWAFDNMSKGAKYEPELADAA